MPPKRSSGGTQQPAQRRPRSERACNFCRIAKQRCEPIEYGTNDRPCRRCVSQGLDCNLPRAARSQSPSSGLGAQGPGPTRHRVAPHPASGATEELSLGSEANVQYTSQQSESVQVPMRWSPLMMPEEGHGPSTTTILPQGQSPLQTTSFLPAAPSMEGYQQSFTNVSRGSNNLESGYYPPNYYGQATHDNTYMANYATQSTSDDVALNLGYTLETPQADGADTPVDDSEQGPAGES